MTMPAPVRARTRAQALTDQEQNRANRRTVKALAALFLAGQVGFIVSMDVVELLLRLVPAPAPAEARWLATMTSGSTLPTTMGVPEGPCQAIERTHAAAWLATYLAAAAGRLALLPEGDEAALKAALANEERYFQLHLAAEDRRMRAAAMQDTAAKLNDDRELSDLLNWHAVIDNKTTPECRAADGKNFKADRMPIIGWPGAVHAHCRCVAGPGVPGAPTLPSV